MMDWIHVSTKTTRVVFDSAVLLQIFYTSPQMMFAATVNGLKGELYVTISVSNRCDLFYIFISYIFSCPTCFGPS
jgi:hypothetical protein